MSTINSNNTYVTPNASGQYIRPDQPAFFAYVSSTIANVTGDLTFYSVIFNVERLDIGSNYDTTSGQFTAPQDGRYAFHVSIYAEGINSSSFNLAGCLLVATNTSYSLWRYNPYVLSAASPPNRNIDNGRAVFDLDAGDTVEVQYVVGSSSKVVDITGGTDNSTFFSGYLVS